MYRSFIFSLLILLLCSTSGYAQKMPKEDVIDVPAISEGLCLHNLFQTNMVIQRDKPIVIWGWAKPSEQVTVSFAGQSGTAATGADRKWKVTLPAMSANAQPQSLVVKGGSDTLTLDNILIGDVWVLGGQSNMEHPIDRVDNGQLEIVSANFPNIRILTVPAQNGPTEKTGFPRLHEWSSWFGRHYRKGDWDVCTPETVRDLSAIGYTFARRVHMASQVPIGVIDASRGGTTVETWTPTEVLKQIKTTEVNNLLSEWDQKIADWDSEKDLENRVKNHYNWVKNMEEQGRAIPKDRTVPTDLRPGPAMDHNRPATCFNSMIYPISGLNVKGVIFHQGFNNALGSGSAGAAMYSQIFGEMIAAWRRAFDDSDLPFGIISLCTEGFPQNRDNYLEKTFNDGIYIREAQYKTFLDLYESGDQNIGFASSFDKRRSWYHPQLKIPVGERIARWALATQYGMDQKIKWKPPMLTEMTIDGDQIVLKMDAQVKAVDDGDIVGFSIAGEDRHFQPAEASWLVTGKDKNNRPQTDRKTIVLTSPHVPKPIHYRYAWGRNPMGNLQTTDHNDLPFATQRSDDWKMEEVPAQFIGSLDGKAMENKRRFRGQVQKALRLDDTKRRLDEARAFIEQNQEKYEKERAALEAELAKEK